MEEEINLADYIKVLLKRKRLILACFFIFVVIAGIISYTTPKVYKIESVLEIGKIENASEDVSEQMIESPTQLLGKIEGNVYGVRIKQNLGISNKELPIIKVENPKETNILIVSIESSETEKMRQVLIEGNNLILADHQKIIETKEKLFENNIESIAEKIKAVQEKIKITLNKIVPFENDIVRIESKISALEEEKENLENKINFLQEQLVSEQTPGTQFALFDAKERLAQKKQETEDLYLNINSLKTTIEDYRLEVNSLEMAITDYNSEIDSLNTSIEEIRPTKIVKEPTISENPVEPRPLLYMAIAGILGIFIGIFWAFGKEWWEKSK
jgi:LPS O-antigen subunit length determinant protein (WzzB/FepE family)